MALNRVIGVAFLALAGCGASPNNIYGGAFGQDVVGNDVSVIVSNVWNEMDALSLADRHCKQYNKSARLVRFENYKAAFDCITSH